MPPISQKLKRSRVSSCFRQTWIRQAPHHRWLRPISRPGHLTALNRYTGFDHTQDPFYPKIRTDWTALNLAALGPAVSVDTNSPPYSHSHELVTSATVPDVILVTPY